MNLLTQPDMNPISTTLMYEFMTIRGLNTNPLACCPSCSSSPSGGHTIQRFLSTLPLTLTTTQLSLLRPRYFSADINLPPILGHVTFSSTMEAGSGDFPIFALCLAGSISHSLQWSPEVGRILRIVDLDAMVLDMAPLSSLMNR